MSLLPVPAPPARCALGHEAETADCSACADLANHHEAFNAWCQSDEALRLHEMDEAEQGFALLPPVVSHPSPECECSGCTRWFGPGTLPEVLRAHGVRR